MVNVFVNGLQVCYPASLPMLCRNSEIPQVRRAPAQVGDGGRKPRGTIGQYFATMHCPVCEQLTVEGVCAQCKKDPVKVATTLSVRTRDAEETYSNIVKVSYNTLSV